VEADRKEIIFQGFQASPGIAIGTALILSHTSPLELVVTDQTLGPDEIEGQITLFEQALGRTREQLRELQKRVQNQLQDSEARIFDAHLLIVDDKVLNEEVESLIRMHGKPAAVAFNKVIRRYIAAISSMEDPYIRERAADIRDVAIRILSNLSGESRPVLDHLPGQRIIIGHDLTPSDTALLDRDNVQAFAIETGSRTSHTAILARSMKIPAVVGVRELLGSVQNGDLVIVDGHVGTVIVNPTDETLEVFAEKETREEEFYSELLKESQTRPETVDGYCIQIAANIDRIDDIADVRKFGAVGIGLFRTEYLFLNAKPLPDEEKQFDVYREMVVAMQGEPVVIRTLDVGGDKLSDSLQPQHEQNPFLGFRAIRFCLENDAILRDQIRAILRASHHGHVKVMFPMISCIEEVRKLKIIVEDEKDTLKKRGQPFDPEIEIGIMIEIPSAAVIADTLAKEVDFFSIGTNDLVQYTLAVDRGNEKVAYLYQPSHPAILSLIRTVVDAARKNRIWVSVCGEMAGDPRYTPLLVGMGVHELSMSPVAVGPVRRVILRMRMMEAEEVAAKALESGSAEGALEISEAFLFRVAPDVMTLAVRGL
jgi:phosphotransferase system enzyme I (PtsI)